MTGQLESFETSETAISWKSTHADVLSPPTPSKEPVESSAKSAAGFATLAVDDRSVVENLRVRCPIVRPSSSDPEETLDRVCILLHGLNERGWEKYNDWAQALADKARCAVVLFPIAFHIDRAPQAWGNFGVMRGVSKERIARYPGLTHSSMANAAISERLDRDPSRFFRSGLMAALDLQDLIQALKSGGVPKIASGARLGFFGYSIGAYMLQCMSLAHEEFAAAGRRFLFCGGPFLSAMTPASKFIMDARAHDRTIRFWVEDLDSELRRDVGLAGLIDTAEGRAYCAMVDPRYPHPRRRDAFSDGATKTAGLSSDTVMPRRAIEDFFKGTDVVPEFLDLPVFCTHITPFAPLGGEPVSIAFERLFDEAAEHLFA